MVVDQLRTRRPARARNGGDGDHDVDRLFHALADATRRDVLARCAGSDQLSVSRLAELYPMSFAAVQKHVAVLQRAGLVTKRRHGREQLVRTEHEAVGRARRCLDGLEATWRRRVDQMTDVLTEANTEANTEADAVGDRPPTRTRSPYR